MKTENKEKKNAKKKVTYIDDGRSFADMSNVPGGFKFSSKGTTSSFKDIWQTYWMAVRMMVKPMLVTIAFLCAAFGITALMFYFM